MASSFPPDHSRRKAWITGVHPDIEALQSSPEVVAGVAELKAQTRADRAIGFLLLEFNSNVLKLDRYPRLYAKQLSKAERLTLATDCSGAFGADDGSITGAMVVEKGHPDLDAPIIREFSMRGFRFHVRKRQFAYTAGSKALFNTVTSALEIIGDEPFGPFINREGDDAQIISWEEHRLRSMGGRKWDNEDGRVLHEVSSVLGSVHPVQDAQILLEAPKFG